MSGRYIQIDHPLLQHKLSFLRDKNTNSHDFREITKEISRILAYEAMRDWNELETTSVETPIARAAVKRIVNAPVAVAIMRAGNPVQEAVLSMLPFASAGHIGIYRDKFIKNTVEYYFKLPENVEGRTILLCDPLIATADTMVAAIDRLKNYHVGKIRALALLVSPQGLEKLHHFHPDVDVIAIQKEEGLTDHGYLIPGLGDAGDRLYQTK